MIGGDFVHTAVVRAKRKECGMVWTEASSAIKKEEQCHGRDIVVISLDWSGLDFDLNPLHSTEDRVWLLELQDKSSAVT